MSAGSRETGLPEALRRAAPQLTEPPEPGRLRDGYRALREFVRVLAPGGRLFVLTLVQGGRTEKVLDVVGKRFDVTGLHPDRTAKLLHSEGIATVHTRPGSSQLRIEAVKAS